ALLILADPLTMSQRLRIVEFASELLLPAMYEVRQFVDAGGLISYGPDTDDMLRRCAAPVHNIAKGPAPRDPPIDRPATRERVINMRAAKELGIAIPQSVLIRADHVIN